MMAGGSDRAGWIAAVATTALLWSVGSLLALSVAAAPGEGVAEQAVLLDLAPAVQPSISAVTDFAPDVTDAPPSLAQAAAPPPDAPDLPTETDDTPSVEAPAAVAQPIADAAPNLPPPPQPLPPTKVAEAPAPDPVPVAKAVRKPAAKAKPAQKPKPKAAPKAVKAATAKAKPATKPPKKAKPSVEPAAKAAAAGGASKPKASKAGGGKGATNPATYGTAVMKKIKSTRKQSAPAKGAVVVGFSIASDGGLKSVQVVSSSGHSGLDKVALDHIRRAQPFPAPPEGAPRNFSFEFIGKP